VTDLDATSSPYLTGAWAPVADESTCAHLEVCGRLPTALSGTYLRNGPNPAFEPIGRYHLFDGDGMVHGVELRDGTARYRNRYVRSRGLEAEVRAGHALYGGLSEFRLPNPDVIAEAGMMKNTANTNVIHHAGRTLALMEAAPPTELDQDLATIGEWDFGGHLEGPMTAHPKVDPDTGELCFFGYSPFAPYVRFHVADRTGALTTTVPVNLPRPVMMHDFAVSQRRVAFFDLPALFDVDAMLAGGAGIRWAPEAGARIGVLDRCAPEAGVRWMEVEPFFMFHVLNAWDDGEVMVVEGCRSARLNTSFGDEPLAEAVMPALHRWRIDAVAGTVAEEPLDDLPSDFPRVNDDRAGHRTRYGYVGHPRHWTATEACFDGVVKHDFDTGSSTIHTYGATVVSGEALFVADPDRAGEDGGWLLNLVHDPEHGSLVVLDAESMVEVARVHIPVRVPSGFHGNWVPAD